MADYNSAYTGAEIDAILGSVSNKQDALTFDTTPTANSTNPVTSGGIKTYVDTAIAAAIAGAIGGSY